MIQDWKSEGKNISLLVKALQKEKGPVKKSPPPNADLDHFSRLGFTSRWLPSI
jgi:hypothetical protein